MHYIFILCYATLYCGYVSVRNVIYYKHILMIRNLIYSKFSLKCPLQ